MLLAILHRVSSSPLVLGPFDSVEEIEEMALRLKITVSIAEVVDPKIFEGNHHRLWTHGTRYDTEAEV